MELKKVKLHPWPVQLNTQFPVRSLGKNECVENTNLITLPNGDVGVHPVFEPLSLGGTERIITGSWFEAKGYPNKLFVFGHKSNAGFIGYIEQGKTTLITLISGLPKYKIPRFVKYRESMYFFGVWVSGYYGVLKYNGEFGLYSSTIPHCGVGCLFRGRLFMSDFDILDFAEFRGPGYLQFTEVGEETIQPSNWYPVGSVDERITDLIPLQDRILIQKANDTWELYFPDYAIENAQMRNISKSTGTIGHMNSKRHFETVNFYNDRAVHVQNPRVINVNPEQLLEVAPNVVKMSLPIEDDFLALFARDLTEQEIYERGINTKWSLSAFQNQVNLELTVTGPYVSTVYIASQLVIGWGESWVINLPQGRYRSSRLVAHGMVDVNYNVNDSIKLYVSSDQSTWYQLGVTKIEEHAAYKDITWDLDIYSYVGDTPKLYFKIWLRNDYRTTIPWPTTLNDITIYCAPTGNELFGSGYFDDRFYVIGQDSEGETVGYGFKDGWMKFDGGDMIAFNLIDPVLWAETFNIIGFGESVTSENGCLLKVLIPRVTSGSVPFSGKTGQLDFDAHDIPKKMRKIFITYKTAGTLSLSVYDEDGLIRKFNLPAKSDFGIEELNLCTNRSKWYQFEIEGNNFDFVLRDLEVWVKVFTPDEL